MVKTNAMRLLDKAKIKYDTIEYEVDENDLSGITIAKKANLDDKMVFKTLVAKGDKTGFLVFCIPVAKEVDLKKAAKAVGEKSVEMLPVKDINKVTGYIRGGCTPIGMKKQYPTVIHESAAGLDEMIVSGGRLGEQILLKPQDLLKVTGGKFADIIRHEE